uniref:Uncharacterized protein n=1 Tax=Oryzias latipes TaxID=8090 RepID=A0A3P9IH70_ORYLA
LVFGQTRKWRINQLEKEKVTLTASHNQEAELTRLRSSLERGEAQRAELQYQLTVSRRDGERAAELSRDREALAGTRTRTGVNVRVSRQRSKRYACQWDPVMDFKCFCLQEQKEALQESERRIMEVERERQREVELGERRAEELKLLTGREERIRREKEGSDQRVTCLESGLEAERAAHLESKFNCEVIQNQAKIEPSFS